MSLIEDINKRIAKLLSEDDDATQKLLSTREKEILRAYKQALKEIKFEISLIYEKYGEDVTYADMVAYQRLTNLEQRIAEQIKLLNKAAIKTTELSIKDIYGQTYYRYGYAMETSIGARLGFGLLDPNVINASILNPLDRIKWPDISNRIAQDYLTRMKRELTQGLIQGYGYTKIANNLNDITSKNAYQRLRIIRTEGHRVQSTARHFGNEKVNAAADRLGLVMEKLWVSTLDKRTRDQHRSMDQRTADEDGYFTLPDGTRTLEPGLTGVAEHDIHCRCLSITQIKNFPPKFRRDNITKEKIYNIPYAQWAEMKGIPNG